jgi:hypothetical protein
MRNARPMTKGDSDGATAWRELAESLVTREEGVDHGKMMSSDAVTYGGKVFAFYTTRGRFEGLGVRLGRDHDIAGLKLSSWEYLAPFKSKPPMKDWILVGPVERKRWPELARLALKTMKAAPA